MSDLESDEPTLVFDLAGPATVCHKDFTLAVREAEWQKILSGVPESLKNVGKEAVREKKSLDAQVRVTVPARIKSSKGPADGVETQVSVNSRINACLCNQGSYVSVTVRAKEGTFCKSGPAVQDCTPFSKESDGFIPPAGPTVDRVMRQLWQGKEPCALQGLVVVAGGTGSGKTDLAQAIVLRQVLGMRVRNKRPPHLVTFEDPIEKWRLYRPGERTEAEKLDPETAPAWQFNFTPRELGKDVTSLGAAINDAKRQTPECMYVGEVRSKSEWEAVCEFAGSGHLVVATTHAGSLVESVGRILEGKGAKTAAERGWVARNLRCCIHMKSSAVKGVIAGGEEKLVDAKFASVWFGSAASVNDLIADGLASVVPNGKTILGRRQFVDVVLPRDWRRPCEPFVERTAVLQAAEELDLLEI